ncbi:N-6 DNA methylase [Streptomyces sp. NPDC020917]|uniref:N-6 DNA methylase n=1 Tax=Streptomyces sp. NPDC020917 TaxID=3365102 RepID=UPI0037882DCD
MDGTAAEDDRLLSRSEIAELAGVRRPAVTNWERRHADYPKPVRSGEVELFGLRAMLGWLDSRPIPTRGRVSGEAEGITYADRVRRNLAALAGTRQEAVAVGHVAADRRQAFTEGRRTDDLARLVGPLGDAVRGDGSMLDYIVLLMSLVFLRSNAGFRWEALQRGVRARSEAIAAAALLRDIGEAADEALRLQGVTPGVRDALLRLEPRRLGDLHEAINGTESLGIDEFRDLVDLFGFHANPRSDQFFTPRPVARLMRDAALTEGSAVRYVYDPYVRAGEMLDVAAERLCPTSPLVLRGQSPHPGTLRLAAMNLALHEAAVELAAGSGAPWNDLERQRGRGADLILTNPPFAAAGVERGLRDGAALSYGRPASGGVAFAWLRYVLLSLRDGGRASVVMPVSAGASTDHRERDIRRKAVEDGAVECIVALPPQLFSRAQVSVCLWFLHRPPVAREDILFVDARGLGDKAMRGPRVLSDEHVAAVVQTVQQWRGRHGFHPGRQGAGHVAVAVPRDVIREAGYSLQPADYIDRWMSVAAAPDDAMSEAVATGRLLAKTLTRAAATDSIADEMAFRPQLPAAAFSYDGLPHGWQRVSLADVVDVAAGPSYSRLPADTRSMAGDVRVVMPKHLRAGRIAHGEMQKVTEDLAKPLARFRLMAGDILCVRSGAQMPPALVEEQEAGWLFGTNLMRLRILDTFQTRLLDPGYLMAYLSLPETLGWLREHAQGTAVPSLSVRVLGQLPLPLPPFAHQQRLGAALGAMDAQITAHREIVLAATRRRAVLAAHLMTGVLIPE